MRVRRSILILLGVLGLASSALPASASPGASGSAGRFIVTLRDGVDARSTAAEYHRRDAVHVDHVYTAVLNGFAGELSEGALGRLQADGRVARIERDGIVTATAEQAGATWGLDRIDQKYLAGDSKYAYDSDGTGVDVYVIDTGIRATHGEFRGRVGNGYDFVGDDSSPDDCNGHGTHVAGTIGGATYGVAKNVTLHAVRVLDCSGSGTFTDVIAGMDWVAENRGPKAVANMSLGGGASSSLDAAAANLGTVVTLAVAAGNDNRSACNYSPARAAEVLTVGATTASDARASYSNYGACVELFAPGSSITSAWHTADDATNTISGTSMATPHVAGVAARLAQSGAAVDQVKAAVLAATTSGVVTSAGSGSPNQLLAIGTGLVPHPPTVTLSRSCSGASCSFTATGRDPDGDAISFDWIGVAGPAQASGTVLGKATGTATKTVTTAGSYTVTVKATTAGAQSDLASVIIACAKKGNRITCS